MLKIKPKFEFNRYDFGLGIILHRENESKKYIRDNKIINYVFGIALLWFTFAIIIKFSRKGRVIKR